MSRQSQPPGSFFSGQQVLVTGGASFIGSHLVEALVDLGARVRVADDLSSGKREHLAAVAERIDFLEVDLKRWESALTASENCSIVFHLAAAHGGRGYISTHPASCATNMALDNIVFETALANQVQRITFASSACVYPTDIQIGKTLLREDMVSFTERGSAFADEEYGWAKLMGEMSLAAFHRQYGIKASSVRIFTAYGPRENESHAIIALIARAMLEQDPFEIWGDGTQTRNFTYVEDIVSGLLLACQHLEQGEAVNAGISDFISLNDAAEAVFELVGWRPSGGLKHLTDQPVGVKHRAADPAFAERATGWRSQFSFRAGLAETIDWYRANTDLRKLRAELENLLVER